MATLTIIVGSVYGNAQHVAEHVAQALNNDGVSTHLTVDAVVNDFTNAEALLVITSTTGQGDIPPNLEYAISDLRDKFPLLTNKPVLVAALGDSSYGDTYCGAGKQIYALLSELQASTVAPMLEVDAMETLTPEDDVLAFVKAHQRALLLS